MKENPRALNKIFMTLVLSGTVISAEARHPWDCIGLAGDEGSYCRAIYHNDFSFCEKIISDGMKFTCHARTRFDENICSVIDDKNDRQYCFKLVREETKVKDAYAARTVREIPHELRSRSAWSYGK